MKLPVVIVLVFLFLANLSRSQSPAASRLSFEVATIKRNTSAQGPGRLLDQPGGRFLATGVTLRRVMGFAYRPWNLQFSGGPDWLDSDRWDIEARAQEGSVPPRTGPPPLNTTDTIGLMVRSLLEDRFQLKVHYETRELPIYELTVANGGPRIRLSEDQSPPTFLAARGAGPPSAGSPLPRGAMRMGRSDFAVTAISMDDFAMALGGLYLGRPTINKTGLRGLYDLDLKWTVDPTVGGAAFGPAGVVPPAAPETTAADPSGVSMFTAIQEQLGLRLSAAKGPVEVLIIDSVQRPSEN